MLRIKIMGNDNLFEPNIPRKALPMYWAELKTSVNFLLAFLCEQTLPDKLLVFVSATKHKIVDDDYDDLSQKVVCGQTRVKI